MKEMTEVAAKIGSRLAEEDMECRVMPIAWVEEAIKEVRHSMEAYADEPAFLNEVKDNFKFDYTKELPNPRSVILVAVPSPKVRLVLAYRGKEITVYIPPTYLDFSKAKQRISKVLEEVLEPSGLKFAFASLPVKLLAVRSGLAQYGRNNITYVGERGSFVRLMAFLSDLPIEDRDWSELKPMDRCEVCKACQKTCPTGAIASDRFMVHADRCLSFLNERERTPFPDWLGSDWHNALVGCLECQRVCPANKGVWTNAEDAGCFSEVETEELLSVKKFRELSPGLQARLQAKDLDSLFSVLSRNLGVLLEQVQ